MPTATRLPTRIFLFNQSRFIKTRRKCYFEVSLPSFNWWNWLEVWWNCEK